MNLEITEKTRIGDRKKIKKQWQHTYIHYICATDKNWNLKWIETQDLTIF